MPTARYHAENIGSFLRPSELLQARADYAGGKIPLEVLRSAEDRAILEHSKAQRKAGIPIFTDGELRRGSWLTDMADAVDGFVADKVILDWKGPEADRRQHGTSGRSEAAKSSPNDRA